MYANHLFIFVDYNYLINFLNKDSPPPQKKEDFDMSDSVGRQYFTVKFVGLYNDNLIFSFYKNLISLCGT